MGILVGAGEAARATDPAPAGWYSGDPHVHRSCGSSPVDVSSIYNTMVTQDLAVVSLLADMGNGEVQNPVTDLPLVNGQDASISTPGRIMHWDAEWHWDATYTQYPHQALGGHVVALGLTNAYQMWTEYTYPIFEWAHQQGGIAGFAHFQYLDDDFPTILTCCTPIEYPVEVALGDCDFVSEDVAGSDYFLHAYYRLLNCGFRPGFAAASDYPCGSVVGPLLTYAQVPGGELTYSNWIHAIADGRTVISRDGRDEFVSLVVNGTATPGDEVDLTGGGSVPVTVTWTTAQSLTGTLELVCNGVVVASVDGTAAPGGPVTLSTNIPFLQSGWLCARRMSPSGHQAHTAAVYVIVNGAPIRASVADAQFYVQWMQNLLANISPGGVWNWYFPTSLAAAQARYQAALSIYQQIAAEAAGELSMSTVPPPYGLLDVPYSTTLTASGGNPPYSWSVTSGSLPPGLTLNPTNGLLSGTPGAVGVYTFTAEVADSSNPAQGDEDQFTLVIAAGNLFTLWPDTATPANPDGGPDSPVELGVKFRSDTNGLIAGIRFFKDISNTGTHVGNLWSMDGTLLASATFTNETDSGWQDVMFEAPVPVASNTVYVASYHAENGHYSADADFFASAGFDHPPLHAPADGVDGSNGVYAYADRSVFPDHGWSAANYWVDVLFQSTNPVLTSIDVTPAAVTNEVGATQQYTAMGTYSDGSMQDLTSQAAWVSSSPDVATIDVDGMAASFAGGMATLTASVGSVTGSALLTVNATGPAAMSLWPNTAAPTSPDGGPDSPVELGVKFYSDESGTIAGIRFYKSAANTGPHVGNLWSSNGTLLASVVFTNETGSGWQQASFAAPVSIASNTLYVASYFAGAGHYSEDNDYFSAAGVDTPPLHAPASQPSAPNGVYAYGSGSAFPTNGYEDANYWVDVLFDPPAPTLTLLTVAPSPATNLVGTTCCFTATGTYSDGSAQDVTLAATWISSAPSVASMVSNNLAAALAAGTTLISAQLGSVSNVAQLVVQDPVTAPQLISPTLTGSGGFQFSFTNAPHAGFTVWSTTNLLLPFSQWSNRAAPVEISPGLYQFFDPQTTNSPQQFYQLSHP